LSSAPSGDASPADLAKLGRPLLWGVVGGRVRWRPRFMLTPNGWPPEEILPNPFDYARLEVAHDSPEFCPRFDPILYAAEPDFSVSGSRLSWWEGRHFHWVTLESASFSWGARLMAKGRNPYRPGTARQRAISQGCPEKEIGPHPSDGRPGKIARKASARKAARNSRSPSAAVTLHRHAAASTLCFALAR
jgi:hypothetical protein